jgi:hypothetical protein
MNIDYLHVDFNLLVYRFDITQQIVRNESLSKTINCACVSGNCAFFDLRPLLRPFILYFIYTHKGGGVQNFFMHYFYIKTVGIDAVLK